VADCIVVGTGAVLAIAAGLWACGAVVGAIVGALVSAFVIYRTIQQWLQQQDAEEED